MEWVNWIEWDIYGVRMKIGSKSDFHNALINPFGKEIFTINHLKKIILCA